MNRIKSKYTGVIDKAMRFSENSQLLRPELWHRFVCQFREDSDFDAGWRGEYWGKMMRGACFVYSYTQNEKLYDILTETITDMIESADESGRISTYAKSHEFDGWDIWCRKYVLLGMQYFLEICTDDVLKDKIVKSMVAQADYIISKIGDESTKIPITSATRHWRGLNSSSILEPIVRLYLITKEKRYLDFAKYIVESGATDVVNIFELAYKDELMPYQYPVTKAYEMISCFEGLLEYYKVTGVEWYKTAVINFANRVLENDFTVIGCCGCTGELFDHSAVRQANTTNGKIMQETCVTVTLMKFMYRLNVLTGDAKYADAFEISLYNAYLGSLNTENIIEPTIKNEHSDWSIEPLPFDSYSPLTSGTRGNGIGGLRKMSDNHYYGCCACIGSLGIGLVPQIHVFSSGNDIIMNLYINGETTVYMTDGGKVAFKTETDYPKSGKVKITVKVADNTTFELKLRNPEWSENTKILVNGKKMSAQSGYIAILKRWQDGDEIEMDFDMATKIIHPTPYGHQVLMNKPIWGHNYVIPTYDREDPKAKNHVALRRGPIMLAQDSRLGYDIDEPVWLIENENGNASVRPTDESSIDFEHILAFDVLTKNRKITMVDYASAGKLWSEKSKMAVWISNTNPNETEDDMEISEYEKTNTVSAENQVENSNLVKIAGNSDSAVRVLFAGNSITRHGSEPKIGWDGDWGMAATSMENDYVHLTVKGIEKMTGKDVAYCIAQVAGWERGYEHGADILNEHYKAAKDFNANIAVIRVGENMDTEQCKRVNCEPYYEQMIKFFGENAEVIVTDTFWKNEVKEKAFKNVSDKNGYVFCSIGDLSKDKRNMALDEFWHQGVAAHPGDCGMKAIADRILDSIRNLDIVKALKNDKLGS